MEFKANSYLIVPNTPKMTKIQRLRVATNSKHEEQMEFRGYCLSENDILHSLCKCLFYVKKNR